MIIRNRVQTTKWNLFFHLVSIFLSIIPSFFLVPLYLKYISIETYGAWIATGNVLMWLTAIDPGLSILLQQRVGVAYGREDWKEVQEYLWSGMIINIVLAVIILVVGIISTVYITEWVNIKDVGMKDIIQESFIIAVYGTVFIFLSYAVTSINQGLQSSKGIGIIFVVVNLISISVTLLLLLYHWGLMAIPVGNLIRGLGLLIGNATYLTWRFISEKINIHISFNKIKTIINLISYTFLARLGNVICNNVDAFVVARFLGLEKVPLLSFTKKIPETSRMFAERPSAAFMPAVSHLIGTNDVEKAQKILSRLMLITIWMIVFLTGGLILFNKEFIKLWIGPVYFGGNSLNLLLIAGAMVGIVSNSFSNIIFALGSIKKNSVASFIQNILYIPLILSGAYFFGLKGVALASLLSTICVTGWYYPYLFFKLLKISDRDRTFFVKETCLACLVIGLICFLIHFLTIHNWFTFISSVITYSASYIGMLFYMSKPFRSEIKTAYIKIRKMI